MSFWPDACSGNCRNRVSFREAFDVLCHRRLHLARGVPAAQTQNVTDVASSKAFMMLAARFPAQGLQHAGAGALHSCNVPPPTHTIHLHGDTISYSTLRVLLCAQASQTTCMQM